VQAYLAIYQKKLYVKKLYVKKLYVKKLYVKKLYVAYSRSCDITFAYNFCLLLLLDSPIFAQFFKEFEKITLLTLLYMVIYTSFH
jgi:hypothetical protein